MTWIVRFHDAFEGEFDEMHREVQDQMFALMGLLQKYGPQLGRPRVDTLKGSKHPNMKELRFDAAGGVWRMAFAFDPEREAVLLVAGDKSGGSAKRFYKQPIAKADRRFNEHLALLRQTPKRK